MATVSLDGCEIFYREAGRGRPLILLHGFPLDSRIWSAQLDGLADCCRVIAPDLRGFGQSSSSDPFTMESLADDVYALAERLGAIPFVLGGLSMGGYVSFALERKYPNALQGLILIDTKAEGDSPEAKTNRTRMIDLCRSDGSSAVALQMMPKMLADDTLVSRPDVLQKLSRIMEECPPTAIEHACLAMRDRPDQSCNLPSIAVPVQLICGQSDVLTPPSLMQQMQSAIPHAQLAVIPGAGHMTPMEQPELVNQAIRRFLQSL